MRNLWRRKDITLIAKGRVYITTVRLTLLYGFETWALSSEALHRLQVFDHRRLRSIGHFSWKQRLGNKHVQHRIFGVQKQFRRLDQIVIGTRMRWLRHVFFMENSRLPRIYLLSEPEIGWKGSHDQVTAWHCGMKDATRNLVAVGPSRLPGRRPQDSAQKWLSTLE